MKEMKVASVLDRIEHYKWGEQVVFCDPEGREIVTLQVENGVAKIGVPTCIPTRGWGPYAAAYKRMMDFVEEYNLSD